MLGIQFWSNISFKFHKNANKISLIYSKVQHAKTIKSNCPMPFKFQQATLKTNIMDHDDILRDQKFRRPYEIIKAAT